MAELTVLFVSNTTSDSHLLPVGSELSRRGYAVRIFDPGAFPSDARVIIEGGASTQRTLLAWGDNILDLSVVRAAWYRRPGNFSIDTAIGSEEATWLREQWRDLVQAIWMCSDSYWVSDPHSIRSANLKLRQLQLARHLGFHVPDYCVTNDPSQARAFVAAQPNGVIVKALGNPAIFGTGRVGMIYTHRLTPDDHERLDDVRHEPTFLQAFVRKRCDVRVTVFGETVFAVAIDSMSTPQGVIDFRRADIMDLPHHTITLPPSVEAACVALVRQLHLQYGAIDLLLTPAGDYVFLEINPNGQWYWIEMVTGLPMTKALCDLLERGMGRSPSIATPRARGRSVLPVGEQVVPVSETVTAALEGVAPGDVAGLAATRAWLETKRGLMLLHIGDVDSQIARESGTE
jgi:hypothetical protein